MVRPEFFCEDAEPGEFGFEGVASATAAGEADGEDQAVVGECGGGRPVRRSNGAESFERRWRSRAGGR